jgi:hypothetical protein
LAVSGTVATTTINTRQVYDHAFRRAKVPPPKITREYLATAAELLHMILTSLSNRGIALWAIQTHILPMYEGRQTLPCPAGTIDTLNTNIRQVTRLTGTYTSSEGDAELAFDGDIDTACTQTTPAGYIAMALSEAATPVNFGILFASTGTVSFKIQSSDDGGATWTDRHTVTDYAAVARAWYWFDVEGLPEAADWRILAVTPTILDVYEFVIANNGLEIPVAKINRDDYMNMPDKSFNGQPTMFYYDKQVSIPNLVLWPAPGDEYTFWQIVATTQRQIMDVGSMTQDLELPAGGFLFVVTLLAWHLSMTIDEAKGNPVLLKEVSDEAARDFWAGQTDSSPTRLAPRIGVYTK